MDDNTLLAIIVFGSIFLSFFIPGVIFVVKAVRARTKRKRCTIPVGVRCTKIEEHYFSGKKGSGHMSYLPTFVGNVNGGDITYKPKYYSPSLYNDLEVGDRIDILVNPNDHKEWFLPDNLHGGAFEEDKPCMDEIGFAILAAILFIGAVGIAYLGFKSV